MPIYKDNKKIVKIYKDNVGVTSFYKDGKLVSLSGGGAKERIPLFNNYYKALYLGITTDLLSTYFQASDINFDPTLRKYEFKYKGDMKFTVYRQNSSITQISKKNIILGGEKTELTTWLPETNDLHTVFIDGSNLYIDGQLSQQLGIGNLLDTNTSQRIVLFNTYTFYGLKIYNGNTLIYDFVPAYYLDNDIKRYVLVDLVTRQSFTSGYLTGVPEYRQAESEN